MPKEVHEIKKFLAGTITSPSETDIPDDAASYSKNIDPVAQDGVLCGIHNDLFLTDNNTWTTNESDAKVLNAGSQIGMINKAGEHSLVYFEDGSYKAITDAFGNPSDVTLGTATAPHSMALNNRELHIGGDTNASQWAGWIENHQFTTSNDGIFLEPAALRPPGALSPVDRAVHCGGSIYAMRRGKTVLYKFNVDGQTFDGDEDFGQTFTNIQTILPDKNDADCIWILDNISAGQHKLYHVDLSDPETPVTWIHTMANMQDDVRDMAQTNEDMWFSRYIPKGDPENVSGETPVIVYRLTTPTEAGSGDSTNVTWDFNHGGTEYGSFTKPISHDSADTFVDVQDYEIKAVSNVVDPHQTLYFVRTSDTELKVYWRQSRNTDVMDLKETISLSGYDIIQWDIDRTNNLLFVSFWNGNVIAGTTCRTKVKSYRFSALDGTIEYNSVVIRATGTDDYGEIMSFALNTAQKEIIFPQYLIVYYPDTGRSSFANVSNYSNTGNITFGNTMETSWEENDITDPIVPIWCDGNTTPGRFLWLRNDRWLYNTNTMEYDQQNIGHYGSHIEGLSGNQDGWAWQYNGSELKINNTTCTSIYGAISDPAIIGVGLESGSPSNYLVTLHNGYIVKKWKLDTSFSNSPETIHILPNSGDGIVTGCIAYNHTFSLGTNPTLVTITDDADFNITRYEILDGTETLSIYTQEDNLMRISDDGNYVGVFFKFIYNLPYYIEGSGDPVQMNYVSGIAVLNNSFTEGSRLYDTNGWLYNTTYYSKIAPGSRVVFQTVDMAYFPEIVENDLAVFDLNNRVSIVNNILAASSGYTPIYESGTPGTTNLVVHSMATSGSFTWDKISYSSGWERNEQYSVPFSFSVEQTGNDSDNFAASTRYYYAVSYEYDGYQESPLITEVEGGDEDATQGEPPKNLTLTVTIGNISGLSKRITAINVYRAEHTNTSSDIPEGYYRLVERLPLDTSWTVVDDDAEKIIIDYGKSFASYESRTGLSEVLDKTDIKWDVSTMLNNHHYVANATVAGLYSGQNLLLKSAAYKPNMFNYVYDALILPSRLTALVAFGGRLFGFDTNNMYRIDPNGLYIEDTMEGIGCISDKSVVVTDYGMCFADASNIYLHDGRNLQSIGTPIARGDDEYSWSEISDTYKDSTVIRFDSNRSAFVVMLRFQDSGETWRTIAWMYNTERKRWDLIEICTGESNLSLLATNHLNGRILLNESSKMRQLFANTNNRRAWTWRSKKLALGADTQDKIFKRLRVTGTSDDIVTTITTSQGEVTKSYENDTDNAKYTLSGNARRGKWIQILIEAATVTVDAIGTIFRRRGVK